MTSGGSERSDEAPETRKGSGTTREGSEEPERSGGSSNDSSGERSDPREKGSSERSDSRKTGEDAPESLLNIAGHEDRTPPGEEDDPFGLTDGDEDGPGDEASSDPDDFYSGNSDDLNDVLEEEADGDDGKDSAADSHIEAVLPDEDVVEDTDDDEVEPVELLVQLAKRGDIDPWDIDIVRVTDEFLEALEDVDLRTSGRALFYASVLLRMKGDELIYGSDDDDDEDVLEPWEQPFDDEPPEEHPPGFDPVEGLEAEMERRLDRKQARGTPETLDELVRDLREAERGSWWKRRREYDTSTSPSGFQRGTQTLDYHSGDDFRVDDEPTEDEVTGTTHNEDIEEIIDDVRSELHEHYDAGRDEVLYAEIDRVGGTRVQTFLALLFLAHRGQVRLQQDELFGDLWIQDPTTTRAPEEAVAD
ncbi:segregation/condensation protein A [Haloarchaeobius sp. TZWWS8]|uniref:segregation/condensation protein A n=1 Tax=Haloarchaeobius sp. TZWWS8 TaxID=3446121 RepID=UPI003EBDB9D2